MRESELLSWLEDAFPSRGGVRLGVGDDMAIVTVGGRELLLTADMLLDGVHFDSETHGLAEIGYKAIACSLSDCAGMGVKPVAATVSLALPRRWQMVDSEQLFGGMRGVAERFGCAIVGGDTTAWDKPLVIDVAMVAEPFETHDPVLRSGAVVGDRLFVTGRLGGSLLGRHLQFTPRVMEAQVLGERLGADLHAMMDLSDGISTDLPRLCDASGIGARLDEGLLGEVVSAEASRMAKRDGRSAMEHALCDGEDFELLLAVEGNVDVAEVSGVAVWPVGEIVSSEVGVVMCGTDGVDRVVGAGGFEHLT